MRTITNNEQLKRYLPHSLKEGVNERTLFEKIESFIEEAEAWIVAEIVGEDTLDAIEEHAYLWNALCRCVANMALYMAVPGLDLVLTSNGFGVVSNQTITPASKSRVDALRQELLASRDRNIDVLLAHLREECSAWLDSTQGKKWTSQIISIPSDCGSDTSYAVFMDIRRKSRSVEESLVDVIVPQALMVTLRRERGTSIERTGASSRIVDILLNSVAVEDKADKMAMDRLRRMREELVDYLRNNTDIYPEWDGSKAAALWDAETYRNKKTSSGFWF